jgi:hypothetical protein
MACPPIRVLVAAALLGGLVTGCKQGVGERCEITSDCVSGLTCQTGSSANNGVCVSPTSTAVVDAAALDAQVVVPALDALPDGPGSDRSPDVLPDGSTDRPADAPGSVPVPADAASDARD